MLPQSPNVERSPGTRGEEAPNSRDGARLMYGLDPAAVYVLRQLAPDMRLTTYAPTDS